jgi:hypothetical protein
MGEAPLLRSIKRTQMIMWLAFAAEPFATLALLLVWRYTQGDRVVKDAVSWPEWFSYLFAILLAAASVVVRRLFLSERRVRARCEGGKVGSEALAVLGSSDARGERLWRLSRCYLRPMLIAWGLNSSITVGGLMRLFTAGDEASVVVLSLVALVLNALAYPRFDRFVERMQDVSLGREGF